MAASIEFRVLELLASRICHDLVSPVSAIGNGLELIEESATTPDDDALQLCIGSQKKASALLQAFRMAFGAGQVAESLNDVRRLAGDLLEQGKVRLDWTVDGAAPQPGRAVARLLLNLIMLAAECLPRGGFVRVRLAPDALEISAEGQDPKGSEEIRAALRSDCAAGDLTARTVQAYFAGRVAEQLGGHLQIATAPGRIDFRASVAAT